MAAESTFPGSPRLEKGALLVYPDGAREMSHRIAFQYNPESMRRTLTPRAPSQEGGARGAAREDLLRLHGPPIEAITLTIVLDAADQVGGDAKVPAHALLPALSVLELLVFPSSEHLAEDSKHAKKGRVSFGAASAPLTLLVWGEARVMPVVITSFSISEEAFDPKLNPILAKVELGLRVVTSYEFPTSHRGFEDWRTYLQAKERMAREAR